MFYPNFNFSEISKNSVEGLNIYHNLLDQLLQKSDVYKHHYALLDPSKIIHTFTKVFANLYQQPDSLIELQKQYVEKSLELINYSLERAQGGSPTPLYKQQHKDKRFSDKSWSNNAYFDFIKQFYLMHRELVERVINLDKTVDIKTRKQALFFINQFLDAISPSNFIYTNPVVLYETMSTNGENIVQGLSNLSKDVEHSKNLFDISRNSRYTFKIGKNIASTPGEVVYKNDLMELICYTPTQKSNHEIPLLIVPPWINKYYILDLSPKNSLIKYLVDKGITVFILSWVNPTAKHHDTLFEDYLSKGALAAIDVIQNQFKINKLNILGYCIGGALVSILLSYLARHKKEAVINTATMLATLLDYREGGDLSLFIDEEQLEHFKENVLPQGYYLVFCS